MIKTFPTLYSLTSAGATQIWFMQIDLINGKYRSTSGQISGAKIVSEWTSAEEKNKGKINQTDIFEQAEKEVKSKYKKQLKTGYFEDIKDIDKEAFFQVMLAKNFNDYKDKIDWSKGVGVQIKYNGGRVVAKKDGLFTRKGEKYISIPHIENALKPFFNKFPDAVLDGEGFNFDRREKLNEIMSLIGKKIHVSDEDLKKSEELIRYYIYDGYGFGDITSDDGYLKRKAAIDNAFFAPCFIKRYTDIIHKVPTHIVYSEKELNSLYKKFLADKQEGAILRILDVPYENKRSKFLLKYKPIDDAEFKIVSIQQGKGKFANRASTITCKRIDGKLFEDGTDTFDATFKGTAEQALDFWIVRNNYINKIATIYYNGFTGYGKPNYAQFDINNWNKGH